MKLKMNQIRNKKGLIRINQLKSLFAICFLLVNINFLHANENHSVKGTVVDASNEREMLPGVNVYIASINRGTTTDSEGKFTFDNLPEGRYEINISFIGYTAQNITVNVPESRQNIRVFLQPTFIDITEVVVTASPNRSAVNYQSSQVYSTSELVRRTSVSLGEMLDGEPGLSSRSFGGGPARPVIRGFDGERVVVLENGERMGDIQSTAPDHAITLDPLGMSRVEVVRGPASLLYGSSAMGGVINIFTEDAPTQWKSGLSGGTAIHGATNNNLYSQSAGLVYGTENHAFAGRLIYRTASDAQTPDGSLPNTQMDSYSGSLGWGFKGNNIRGGISGRYYQNDYGVPEFAAATDPENPDLFIEEEPEMEVRIHRWNAQANFNLTLNGFFDEIESRTSFSHSVQEEGEQDVPYEELELEIITTTVSSSLLFHHQAFSFFDRGVIGANLHRRYQMVDGLEAYHPGEDIYNLALYTFQEIPFSERLRMQIGVRAENEWLSSVENRYFTEEERTEDVTLNVVGSLGLNFRPFTGWEMGLQFARAHRNATILERYADGWHAGATRVELGDPTLTSEHGLGVDFFTKYSGTRMQFEVAGFYNRINNFIALYTLSQEEAAEVDYRVQPDREFPQTVQFFGTDAELMGLEFKSSIYLVKGLRFDLGVDYVHANRLDKDGQPLPFIPPFRSTLGLLYNLNNLTVGSSVRLVGAQNRVPDDELPTDGYALLRFEAGYRFHIGNFGMHTINLRVDNALNTAYQDHMSVTRRYKDPVKGPAAPSRYSMPGRNFNLIYRFTF